MLPEVDTRILCMNKKATQAEIFETLLKPHMNSMYKTAYRLVSDRDAAEDLVQEALVKLYPKTDEMQVVEMLGPWLKKVVYRQFVDELRKKTRRPENYLANGDGEIGNMNNPADNPEKMVEISEIRKNLQAALDSLDERHRLVVMMHLVEGYTLNEMSEIYDVPQETLKTQIRRAKVRLKNFLKM